MIDLAKAARLARMALAGFVQELDALGIAAVRYPAKDLDEELEVFGDT